MEPELKVGHEGDDAEERCGNSLLNNSNKFGLGWGSLRGAKGD